MLEDTFSHGAAQIKKNEEPERPNLVFRIVTGYRYITHLYCLAVHAGFCRDVVECKTLNPADRVRSLVGEYCYLHFFHLLYLVPNVNNPHVCIKLLESHFT